MSLLNSVIDLKIKTFNLSLYNKLIDLEEATYSSLSNGYVLYHEYWQDYSSAIVDYLSKPVSDAIANNFFTSMYIALFDALYRNRGNVNDLPQFNNVFNIDGFLATILSRSTNYYCDINSSGISTRLEDDITTILSKNDVPKLQTIFNTLSSNTMRYMTLDIFEGSPIPSGSFDEKEAYDKIFIEYGWKKLFDTFDISIEEPYK